jgi:hypothetical protein
VYELDTVSMNVSDIWYDIDNLQCSMTDPIDAQRTKLWFLVYTADNGSLFGVILLRWCIVGMSMIMDAGVFRSRTFTLCSLFLQGQWSCTVLR